MNYPKIPLAQHIISLFESKKIKNIIISPGSRNAALSLGFASNPYFQCYSIVDERCAAFFALGIAQQTQQPAAVICTSGSAVLNYYPAVAEAFYSQIPIIILSADRPKNKIDIGDGQTIRQENVFENHSLYNANLTETASDENDLDITTAIDFSIQFKGPVHINAPFEEPLYQMVDYKLTPSIQSDFTKQTIPIDRLNLSNFAEIWNTATKKLILVGTNFPNNIDPIITQKLVDDPSVVILTENISNWHHPKIFGAIDALISPFDEFQNLKFQPQILITFGGMIVSKRIKTLLRQYKPKHHWHIDPLYANDTFECLSQHIEFEVNDFFNAFQKLTIKSDSDYFQTIKKYQNKYQFRHQKFLATAPFSDLKAFEIILNNLPKNCHLQLANSATIRYAQLFEIDKTIKVCSNRGTSGIDGCTSTAIGAATTTSKQTILITGDLGFFYDSNALWNQYIPKNFKIILINNGGGGIFRILPGHQETQIFDTFFETSHCLTAKNLANMYDFDYFIASKTDDLTPQLNSFFEHQNKSILEIFTPTKLNNSVLTDYFAFLSKKD